MKCWRRIVAASRGAPVEFFVRINISNIAYITITPNVINSLNEFSKGEFVIVVEGNKEVETIDDEFILKEVNDLVPSGTTAASIPLYSQNSGNDFKWLDEYEGEEVTILVGVQNLNLKASGSFYRCCPIKVL